MARTPSTMLELGTSAPDFKLPDPEGRQISLADFADKSALLVMFICNHCPFVKHIRSELANLGKTYSEKGVGIVAINSNDVANYPDDSPANMAKEIAEAGYVFPYLYDETQEVAKTYHAACTPDFFLFDGDRKLAYRGQLDDSRPGNDLPVTGKDLRAALDAVIAGQSPASDQQPSIGCNIKWKAGNEPDYA
jgi:peroxiredoxin